MKNWAHWIYNSLKIPQWNGALHKNPVILPTSVWLHSGALHFEYFSWKLNQSAVLLSTESPQNKKNTVKQLNGCSTYVHCSCKSLPFLLRGRMLFIFPVVVWVTQLILPT